MKLISFFCLWFAACSFAAGSWNGVAVTHWNGIAFTAWNGTSISAAGGGGGTSYLVNQGFEGTGYDNSESWTEAGTGVNEDYATSPIVGSQSLAVIVSSQSSSTYVTFTAQDSVHFFARVRIESLGNAGSVNIFRFRTSSNTEGAAFQIRADGKASVTADGGTANAATEVITTGSDLYFWGEYTKGTGSNAVAKFGWSDTSTKPTLSAGGARTCSSTNGTGTAQVARLYVGTTTSTTYSMVFDRVLVDDVTIGDNP